MVNIFIWTLDIYIRDFTYIQIASMKNGIDIILQSKAVMM